MSSLELGPVSYNPVVYAADPRLLDETGVLVDVAETWLPAEVTRVATSTSGPAGPSAYSARSPG